MGTYWWWNGIRGCLWRVQQRTIIPRAGVYFNKLGNAEWNIAEAGSHEFGHNLGL